MAIKLVCGVGVNDADYNAQPYVLGKRVVCTFYGRWKNMISRCYDEKVQKKHPTYIGCSVCEEWFTFSNFKKWMEKQDWKGNELDKDLLFAGNKIYSPSTCVFVNRVTNRFTNDRSAARGLYMIGVCLDKAQGNFYSQCRNPITGKNEFLGRYPDEISAHLAWKKRKHELACRLADLQADKRVADALRSRYQKNYDQGDPK